MYKQTTELTCDFCGNEIKMDENIQREYLLLSLGVLRLGIGVLEICGKDHLIKRDHHFCNGGCLADWASMEWFEEVQQRNAPVVS